MLIAASNHRDSVILETSLRDSTRSSSSHWAQILHKGVHSCISVFPKRLQGRGGKRRVQASCQLKICLNGSGSIPSTSCARDLFASWLLARNATVETVPLQQLVTDCNTFLGAEPASAWIKVCILSSYCRRLPIHNSQHPVELSLPNLESSTSILKFLLSGVQVSQVPLLPPLRE